VLCERETGAVRERQVLQGGDTCVIQVVLQPALGALVVKLSSP